MTLYQQIQRFYKVDKFRFNERAKKIIGARVAASWREKNPGNADPPQIESIEDSGTYMVLDYPDNFAPIMYFIIKTVHQEILQAAKERRLKSEVKSSAPLQPEKPITTSGKIRKRIPIRNKPLWKADEK